MDDNPFEPLLGPMRSAGSRRGRRYLHRVIETAARAGGRKGAQHRPFEGSRIGRGAASARLLGARDGLAAFRRRRVIIKTRLVRLGGKGLAAARAHLRYIQRDGGGRKEDGGLYGRDCDRADGKAFLAKCDGDRHQFRFIVSAEDGAEYEDLKPLTRRLMARMEADLGTGLEWVAADHLDTGHPHTHIMLRGKDDRGENLVIARDYIARGMRERLAEIVTLDLGPRTDWEIKLRLRLEVDAERLTSIDRRLVREMDDDHRLAAAHRDPFQDALRAGRLRKLQSLGLADQLGGGRWKLDAELEGRLRAMGERGDIVRTMQRELSAFGLERASADRVIHGRSFDQPELVGRVIGRGLSDEVADRHFLLVDGVDGRVHHLDIGPGAAVEPLPEQAIVRISPNAGGRKPGSPLVELVSPLPLGQLPECNGQTWLDELLAHERPLPLRDAGFGREVRAALSARRQWLIDHELGAEVDGNFAMRPGLMAELRRRELGFAAGQLSRELGLTFVAAEEGERIEGILRRRVDLASGRFALVEYGRDFTFVPWRTVLERHIGKEISVISRHDGIGWSIGRGRGGPEVT